MHMHRLIAGTLLGALSALPSQATGPDKDAVARFAWFEYEGRDDAGPTPGHGEYRNPILAGFYPDPSICRVGADYYLVTSSFAYFPGVPIFRSRDLVHWEQIGHVLTRPSQLQLDGLGVSRGIFAPTLRHRAGVFYMITTAVDSGGNFYVTATDPAGPWSDPVWLPEIDGIDPSFFFDDNGKAYVINNGPPPGDPLYDGHRALWIQELDLAAGKLVGRREVIVDGGVDPSQKPIWIEGPHIFKRDGWYVLIAAEGGTAEDHSEVVFRSRSVRGPYVPWEKNPILTQRTLDDARPNPVTSTGHADLVQTEQGDWWAVFLGCRPYEGRLYNTGRETFLLPVGWDDGWPTILDPGLSVPLTAPRPAMPPYDAPPMTGPFTWRDDFAGKALGLAWNSLRGPAHEWLSLSDEPGTLVLHPRDAHLIGRQQPAFVGRRQQHIDFTATTSLETPTAPGFSSGITAFQNETYHFFLGARRGENGVEVFLEQIASNEEAARPSVVARAELPSPLPQSLRLRVEGHGAVYAFAYAVGDGPWVSLKNDADGTILSTAKAGGFVGTYLGLHARTE